MHNNDLLVSFPISLTEAANLARVQTRTWTTGSKTSENSRVHHCAFEPGVETVVYSKDKNSLAKLLSDWSLIKMYKDISLVEFAGIRGFEIKRVNDNPEASVKKFDEEEYVTRITRKEKKKPAPAPVEESSEED